ncbi:uncharacterized protein LOC123556609 isoform X2 [Mercenaria mercenaria]|uniref:uncharacterized protein LOC123556609 isoform X2 n=1 Tax=Mercenaria mercenaria TaxID=6596 RepID=UPI00234F6B57|nr:uncharacterized protein LOC123556609 isoform X2 [Mercenaria mercenaria]
MNFISSTLICIVLIGQSSSAVGNLFLCNDKHLINIKLECPGDNKIDIIDAWDILSTHKYNCENNATFSETRYGLSNEVMHKILMKCFYQRKCMVKHFRDEHGPNKHRGIGIEYACIPDKKFINLCHGTPKIPLTDVYLINQIYERNEHSRCHCDLSYHGRFVVTVTHFPTEWMHLKVKTWNMTCPHEKVYKDQVYKHETVYINTDTPRQQYTVINNAVNRKKDELAFLLVNISAGPGHHSTKKQPTSTVETPSAARYAAVSSFITAVCLLGICASTFLIYRRFVTKKEIDSSRNNASMRSLGAVSTVERNLHASVYVDCGGRLSHSYAEIGSLSDYRHYVMPDETSQQSLKVKSRYKTLVEECYSGDSQNNDGETSNGCYSKSKD